MIPLRQPDSRARVLTVSPSGKVPALITADQTIWESLAIIEYLAETHSAKPIWPRDPVARAHARAVSNEMHGGFQTLRQGCPMNIAARYKTPAMTEGLQANVDRVEEIWSTTRSLFGADGPYLFGDFSAADAMYAPVASRFESYQIPVASESRAYMDAIFTHPAFAEWREAALAEPWNIADYASGHELVQSFR